MNMFLKIWLIVHVIEVSTENTAGNYIDADNFPLMIRYPDHPKNIRGVSFHSISSVEFKIIDA